MNKYIIPVVFIAGLITTCLLSYFGIFSCAGCSAPQTWAGNCTDAIGQAVQDQCCIEVDMCGGYTTTSPSECYHRYCTLSDKFCQPGAFDIATQSYACECGSIYV